MYKLSKFKKRNNLERIFKQKSDYDALQSQLCKEKSMKKKITLIFDFESVFLAPLTYQEFIEMDDANSLSVKVRECEGINC